MLAREFIAGIPYGTAPARRIFTLRRRNEIGWRMALVADRTRVIRHVLREAFLLLGLGLAAGTILSVWAGKAAASLCFGLQPHHAGSLLAAGSRLAVIALIASYVPAKRAAALNPMTTLRSE